jgi:hypothetical protein
LRSTSCRDTEGKGVIFFLLPSAYNIITPLAIALMF